MLIFQTTLSKQANTVQSMFSSIADRYDLGNTVLSFGIHHIWRRKVLAWAKEVNDLGSGSGAVDQVALDLCTGTGDLLPGLEKIFPRVVGADFCAAMLEKAKTKGSPKGERNLVEADALNLPFENNSFDLVTVSFGVRNFENLQKGLLEIYRVLKPSGRLIVLEFGQPKFPIFSSIYRWYSANIMPLIGGLVTGNKAAYKYLPETAKQFPCGEGFKEALAQVGLQPERATSLTLGIAWVYMASKNGA